MIALIGLTIAGVLATSVHASVVLSFPVVLVAVVPIVSAAGVVSASVFASLFSVLVPRSVGTNVVVSFRSVVVIIIVFKSVELAIFACN